MKPIIASFLTLLGACALCCTVPLLVGAGVIGMSVAALTKDILTMVAVAALGIGIILALRFYARRKGCGTGKAGEVCGCTSSCDVGDGKARPGV